MCRGWTGEFIDSADATQAGSAEQRKQDCALKAFERLAPKLKAALPQTRLVLAADSLFACGRVFPICKDNHWSFVLTFQQGHLPAV